VNSLTNTTLNPLCKPIFNSYHRPVKLNNHISHQPPTVGQESTANHLSQVSLHPRPPYPYTRHLHSVSSPNSHAEISHCP
jgi:hypothetical protein